MEYTADTPVAVLGQHTRVSLAKFLQVMHALLWLEGTCADVEARRRDFTYGLAQSLYREKTLKRTNRGHMVRLPLFTAWGRQETDQAFAAHIRDGLQQAGVAIDDDGVVCDAEAEQIMHAALQFHCGGGCRNIGYVALPLRNDDVLGMLRQTAVVLGYETPITVWNPAMQVMVEGVPVATYLDVWTKLRAMLKTDPTTRDEVLKRLGGMERERFFAGYGIDVSAPNHAGIVFASLRKFCPPTMEKCQARVRLAHAIRPADFVMLMQQTVTTSLGRGGVVRYNLSGFSHVN
jgi:hypothetical protein